jgi:hypothetical protein
MKKLIFYTCFSFFILSFCQITMAQTTRKEVNIAINSVVTVVTKTNQTFVGVLKDKTGENIVLVVDDNNTTVTVAKKNLRSMNISGRAAIEAAFAEDEKRESIINPSTALPFYTLAQAAVPMEKGSGYYRNVMILGNQFVFVPSKNLSLFTGFPILGLIEASESIRETPIWYGAKYTLFDRKAGWNAAVGIAGLSAPFSNDQDNFGRSIFGTFTATHLGQNGNISIGAGLGRYNDSFDSFTSFYLSVSGGVKIAKKDFLMTDNLRTRDDFGDTVSNHNFFYRHISNRRGSFDLGFGLLNSGFDEYVPYPYLAFSIPFR